MHYDPNRYDRFEDDILVGLPSGQIITITNDEAYILLPYININYDVGMEGEYWEFNDEDYDEIIEILYEIKKGTVVRIKKIGKVGEVVDIIEYDGQLINGRNLSKIYSPSDILYMVKFRGTDGVYIKDDIEKVRDVNEEIK